MVVDAAMNDLIRPSLYDAYHKIEVADSADTKKEEMTAADIVGPVCESGDFFGKNVMLPPLGHDALVVIYSAGAYGFSMSSNYNTRGRAAEVALVNGEDHLIRKREQFEDIVALELACESGWQRSK